MRRILALTLLAFALLGGVAVLTSVDASRAVACDFAVLETRPCTIVPGTGGRSLGGLRFGDNRFTASGA